MLEELIKKLKELKYKLSEYTFGDGMYYFKVSGNNIFGFITPQPQKCVIPYEIAIDNKNCFDKTSKCPIKVKIPENEQQLEELLFAIKFFGTKEGYEISNNYEVKCWMNDYNWKGDIYEKLQKNNNKTR